MRRERPIRSSASGVRFPSFVGDSEPERLMSAFLNIPSIGVAICDRRLRYTAINKPLATMNGIPAHMHLGKTLYDILGEVAEEVACACEDVLATGAATQKEIRGVLPARAGSGEWIATYFPINDDAGKVKQVGVIVLEVPVMKRKDIFIHKFSERVSNGKVDSIARDALAQLQPGKSVAEILRSWKEIAHYAASSVRTVQRWEREFGLPVRRTKAAKGAVVFAFEADLEDWLRERHPSNRSR